MQYLFLLTFCIAVVLSAPVQCQQRQSITLTVTKEDDCTNYEGCLVECTRYVPNCGQWNHSSTFMKLDLPLQPKLIQDAYRTACEKRMYSSLSPYWVNILQSQVSFYSHLLQIKGPALPRILKLTKNLFRAWRGLSVGTGIWNHASKFKNTTQIPEKTRNNLYNHLLATANRFYYFTQLRDEFKKDFPVVYSEKYFSIIFPTLVDDFIELSLKNREDDGRFGTPFDTLFADRIMNKIYNPKFNLGFPKKLFGVPTLTIVDNMGPQMSQFLSDCAKESTLVSVSVFRKMMKQIRVKDPQFPFGSGSTFNTKKLKSEEYETFEKLFFPEYLVKLYLSGHRLGFKSTACTCASFKTYFEHINTPQATAVYLNSLKIIKEKCAQVCKTQPPKEPELVFND